jgi:hypothetical protein
MKIILPMAGEDVAEHFHNIYHRIVMTNESVITSFNGVTAVLFPDEAGFDHPKGSPDPRYTYNLDAVKSYYMRELEKKEPSGYTIIKNYNDRYDIESRKAREKVKKIKSLIETLKNTQNSHMTTPSINSIISQLEDAVK